MLIALSSDPISGLRSHDHQLVPSWPQQNDHRPGSHVYGRFFRTGAYRTNNKHKHTVYCVILEHFVSTSTRVRHSTYSKTTFCNCNVNDKVATFDRENTRRLILITFNTAPYCWLIAAWKKLISHRQMSLKVAAKRQRNTYLQPWQTQNAQMSPLVSDWMRDSSKNLQQHL